MITSKLPLPLLPPVPPTPSGRLLFFVAADRERGSDVSEMATTFVVYVYLNLESWNVVRQVFVPPLFLADLKTGGRPSRQTIEGVEGIGMHDREQYGS